MVTNPAILPLNELHTRWRPHYHKMSMFEVVREHFSSAAGAYSLDPDVRERTIADISMLPESSRLVRNIAARLLLEKIAEAHELVEGGRAIGNVVLQIE